MGHSSTSSFPNDKQMILLWTGAIKDSGRVVWSVHRSPRPHSIPITLSKTRYLQVVEYVSGDLSWTLQAQQQAPLVTRAESL